MWQKNSQNCVIKTFDDIFWRVQNTCFDVRRHSFSIHTTFDRFIHNYFRCVSCRFGSMHSSLNVIDKCVWLAVEECAAFYGPLAHYSHIVVSALMAIKKIICVISRFDHIQWLFGLYVFCICVPSTKKNVSNDRMTKLE